MFTFGFSPIIDLDDARLFAQQFQPEEDRPTLRRIARASALCHHNLVWCLDASRFTVRSQRDLDVQYKVASAERNHLNRFIKAKKLNKRMVLDYLQGRDPRKFHPLYHAPLVPTFAGVIDIFELKRLEKIKLEIKQSQGGLYVAIVQLYDRGSSVEQVHLKTEMKGNFYRN